MIPTIVCAKNISKTYGEHAAKHTVLSSVSLDVQQGEFVAILGPSGCGKSTLLGILGGLDRRFDGEVELFGQRVSDLDDASLARVRNEHIGFVFQAFHLLMHLSVLDNVLLPALFSKQSMNQDDANMRAMELLEKLGLAEKASSWPSDLSGGQRQRVAVARALFHNPPLLFCDEPTGNLDNATAEHVAKLFHELHTQEKRTVVVVTHDEHFTEVAGRVLKMDRGNLHV